MSTAHVALGLGGAVVGALIAGVGMISGELARIRSVLEAREARERWESGR